MTGAVGKAYVVKDLKLNLFVLWMIALAAPSSIILFEEPVRYTPIRAVAVFACAAVICEWLFRCKIKLSINEILFFLHRFC